MRKNFIKSRFLLFAFLLVCCLVFSQNVFCADSYTVTASSLRVRKQPTTSSETIGQFKEGQLLDVYSIDNGWAKILYKGQYAYVSAQYLKATTINTNSFTEESNDDISILQDPPVSQSISQSQSQEESQSKTQSAANQQMLLEDALEIYYIGWPHYNGFELVGAYKYWYVGFSCIFGETNSLIPTNHLLRFGMGPHYRFFYNRLYFDARMTMNYQLSVYQYGSSKREYAHAFDLGFRVGLGLVVYQGTHNVSIVGAYEGFGVNFKAYSQLYCVGLCVGI